MINTIGNRMTNKYETHSLLFDKIKHIKVINKTIDKCDVLNSDSLSLRALIFISA